MDSNAQSMVGLAKRLIQSFRPTDTGTNGPELDGAAQHVAAQIKANVHGGPPRREWDDVRNSLHGLAKFARVSVEDDVAAAYGKLVRQLEHHRRLDGTTWDENIPLHATNIPQHVHLLLALSGPIVPQSREIAEEILTREPVVPKSDMEIYDEIMAEPFAGDHWGPGYDEEVQEGWTESEESSGSDTATEEEIVTPAAKGPRFRSSAVEAAREAEGHRRADEEFRQLLAKLQLRELGANAYWKSGGYEVPTRDDLYGWRALSTVPAMASPALKERNAPSITASQLQRELLFALTGRPGVLLGLSPEGECSITPHHPNVACYTPVALEGILRDFAIRATQAATLRAFIAEALTPVSASERSETREAFAEACRLVLNDLGTWIAELESAFMGSGASTSTVVPGATSTPLLLHLELTDRFGDLLDHLCGLVPFAMTSANGLLNALYSAICAPTSQSSRSVLLDIFIQSATPMWRLLGDWLVHGMPVPDSLISGDADLALQDLDDERPLNHEFFIQRDRDSSRSDEDFWEAGYVVDDDGWPAWLAGAQEVVLEGGKSRGLLRSLMTADDDTREWEPLSNIIGSLTDDIPYALSEYIAPFCSSSQTLLGEVLEWDCAFQRHLTAIDGLTLMRGFVVIDSWADWLFGQMRAHKPWADFQLLTHSLRDTIESQDAEWMNAHSVRARTLRARGASLADIRVDYIVPFPLSQLFTPTAMDLRSEVFTFLLRLLRARKVLLKVRMLAETQAGGRPEELSQLRRLRHATAWVLDTIWIWINNVIEIRTGRHAKNMTSSVSFQRLISYELDHVRQLRRFCFLHAETSATLESIEAITGLSEDLLRVATSTQGVARPTPAPAHARSRRRSRHDDSDDSDDGSDDDDSGGVAQEGDGDSSTPRPKLDQIAETLNTHVRKLRQGVDTLAAQGGMEAADNRDMWGMLVFVLGDWVEPQ